MIDTAGQTTIPNTMLVLDVDQSITRAVLCDVVEGSARLVDVAEAVTTSGSPFDDMAIGINQAIRQLEDQTGRRLLEGDQLIAPARPDGDGVDRVFVTGIPIPPNNIGLLSLDQGETSQLIRNAARRTISVVSDAAEYLHWLGAGMSPTAIDAWLRDSRPTTVIMISGESSMDDWRGALEAVASSAPGYGAVQGIIIGDEERQQVAAEVLDDALELSGIDPAAYDKAEIASAIESELREQYATRLPAEPGLQAFSNGMFVDRMQGVESVAAFLHRRMGSRLAVLSIQSGTLLEIAANQGALTVYRGDIDLGSSARTLLKMPTTQIARWVPSQMTEDEIRHWLLNRALRPSVRIYGETDQAIAGAVMREMTGQVTRSVGVEDPTDVDLVVLGREIFDSVGDAGVLVAVDALQVLPSDGAVMLSVDRDGIIASLGAIAAGEPDYAREVIENDFLAPLGTCIVLNGQSQSGNRIADVEIVRDDGERQELTLSWGEVRCLPLAEGHTAEVTVTPVSSISVGRYTAGEPVTFNEERAIHGGQFGIILDGRGRPCDLPSDNESRIQALSRWSGAFAGNRD
jgi:hypothetical protein